MLNSSWSCINSQYFTTEKRLKHFLLIQFSSSALNISIPFQHECPNVPSISIFSVLIPLGSISDEIHKLNPAALGNISEPRVKAASLICGLARGSLKMGGFLSFSGLSISPFLLSLDKDAEAEALTHSQQQVSTAPPGVSIGLFLSECEV